MSAAERWAWIVKLDEKILKGDVVLPGWCTMIVKEADFAYAHHAHLPTILTAVAGIESYLRSQEPVVARKSLSRLIDNAEISSGLKRRLHALRMFRNRWVHVDDPWDDEELIDNSEMHENELAAMAQEAIVVLRETIYSNQGV